MLPVHNQETFPSWNGYVAFILGFEGIRVRGKDYSVRKCPLLVKDRNSNASRSVFPNDSLETLLRILDAPDWCCVPQQPWPRYCGQIYQRTLLKNKPWNLDRFPWRARQFPVDAQLGLPPSSRIPIAQNSNAFQTVDDKRVVICLSIGRKTERAYPLSDCEPSILTAS